MKLKAGKSAKIVAPNFGRPARKVHIDYILDNPEASTPEEKSCDDLKLVVYRVWHKNKGYFKYYIHHYYVLCMYNNWEHDFLD